MSYFKENSCTTRGEEGSLPAVQKGKEHIMCFGWKKMDHYKNQYPWKRFKDPKGAFEITNFSVYINPIFNIDEVHAIILDNLVDYESPSLNSSYL